SEQQMKEQQQGQQGNAQQAEQLAEMQKQIVNGIWKLIRREISAKPTDRFAGDLDVLKQSQQAVLEKAAELMQKLQAPASKDFLTKAMSFMTQTGARLAESAEKPTTAPLPAALSAAQAAYQALLKLRAREFEVQKGSRRNQSARMGSQSRSP